MDPVDYPFRDVAPAPSWEGGRGGDADVPVHNNEWTAFPFGFGATLCKYVCVSIEEKRYSICFSCKILQEAVVRRHVQLTSRST